MKTKQESVNNSKKSRKKMWLILLLLLLLLFITGGGIATAIVLKNKDKDTFVRVTFDPVKVSANNNQEHLNNAERFTLNLSEGKEENSQFVDENLNEGEYIIFCYTISNDGPSSVSWSLNLENLSNKGFKIQYRIGELGDVYDFGEGVRVGKENLAAGATDKLWVYFTIDNLDNPVVSGCAVLSISVV